METIRRTCIYTFFVFVIFLLPGPVPVQGATDPALLPEDPLMDDTFRPGFGPSVGMILAVEGEAMVMHADRHRGYRVIGGLPLYKGDVLVTMSKTRLRLKLNDESIITMTSRTRLTIDESLFDRAKKRFISFLKLSIGKARFYVRKVRNMQHPEYRVKTPTAVVGVRGSDFITDVIAGQVTITAFEETELEVASIHFPERTVVVLEYNRTLVREGRFPTDPIRIPLDEIEIMKREYELDVEDEKGEGVTVSKETVVQEESLSPPSDPGPEGFEDDVEPDAERQERLNQLEDDFTEQRLEIEEGVAEGPTVRPLPNFPELPQSRNAE
jgi:hypothetical protein